jgi:peptide deformylase
MDWDDAMSKRKRIKAKLRLYPDPILTQVCEPVKDGEDVSVVIRDMMHILTNSKSGVGLAAPQAGHLKTVIIVKESEYAYLVMINPVWSMMRSGVITMNECCLSYPGKTKSIERFGSIRVTYTSGSGALIGCERFDNFEARIIQHEIDHLNGRCKVGEK